MLTDTVNACSIASKCVCLCACSQDCQQWSQLPDANRSLRDKCACLQGRFTGRPEHTHEQKLMDKVGEGDNMQEQTSTVSTTLA